MDLVVAGRGKENWAKEAEEEGSGSGQRRKSVGDNPATVGAEQRW